MNVREFFPGVRVAGVTVRIEPPVLRVGETLMKIGVPRETYPGERRVALVPGGDSRAS